MNGDFALTDHMADLKRTVSAVLNRSSVSGRAVAFSETEIITGKINTAVALARELEEENRILEHRIRALRDDNQNRKADLRGNVTSLPRPSPSQKKGQ